MTDLTLISRSARSVEGDAYLPIIREFWSHAIDRMERGDLPIQTHHEKVAHDLSERNPTENSDDTFQ